MSVVILCNDHHKFTNPVTSIDPNPKFLVGGKPSPPPHPIHWVPKLAQSLTLSKCSINTCKMREFNMLLFPRLFIKWRCTI